MPYYFVFVVADYGNQVPEFGAEGNNAGFDPVSMLISPAPQPDPGLFTNPMLVG